MIIFPVLIVFALALLACLCSYAHGYQEGRADTLDRELDTATQLRNIRLLPPPTTRPAVRNNRKWK